MADNPFQLVYNGLWDLVERNTTLMDLIKTSNRVKYDDDIGAKRAISDADLPELDLRVAGISADLQATSSTCEAVRSYDWRITTGNLNVLTYETVLWEFYRSMVDWDKFVCGLEWEYSPGEFVQVVNHVELLDADEGTDMGEEQERNIRGWASIWLAEVRFSIPTALIRIP